MAISSIIKKGERGIENQGTLNPLVVGSNPTRVTQDILAPSQSAVTVTQKHRIVTPIVWLFAPEWLTITQACELSGHTWGVLRSLMADGAVDTNDDGLICKQSLFEFQECLALVGHWND